MATVEYLVFPASKAYLEDPSLISAPLDIVSKAEGFRAAYAGLQVEDQATLYALLTWDSFEAHKAIMDVPSYKEVIDALKPCVGGDLNMQHFDVGTDPTAALNAPVTECCLFTLKPGKTRADIAPLLDETAAFAETMAGKGYHLPAAWGQSREHPEVFLMLIGYDTVQAHIDGITSSPKFMEIAGRGAEVADVGLKHATVKKYY